MRSLKVLGLVSLLLVGFSGMVGARDKSPAIKDSYHITFVASIHVGSALLPAGDYTVQHVMDGQDHFMVFRDAHGKIPQVKVKCTLVPLPEKAGDTSTSYVLNAANERVLQGLTFSGDKVKHVF
jgi:hypothetical protein